MKIYQHYADNSYRNYNYLLACPISREAIAIDPLDYLAISALLEQEQYQLTAIINTHEHHDHVNGNLALLAQHPAPVLAHHHTTSIPGFTTPLRQDDEITFGHERLQVLDTPGHTHSHVCLFYAGTDTQPPALFSGDTLFNAGAGNCHNGGDVNTLYETFTEILSKLDSATRLYPGHDYIENNCRFTLDTEPDNRAATAMLERLENHSPHDPIITTLAIEREINCFLRLDSDRIRQSLKIDPLSQDIERAVFVALRDKRNQW